MTQVKDRLPALMDDSDDVLQKFKREIDHKIQSAQSSRRKDQEQVSGLGLRAEVEGCGLKVEVAGLRVEG